MKTLASMLKTDPVNTPQDHLDSGVRKAIAAIDTMPQFVIAAECTPVLEDIAIGVQEAKWFNVPLPYPRIWVEMVSEDGVPMGSIFDRDAQGNLRVSTMVAKWPNRNVHFEGIEYTLLPDGRNTLRMSTSNEKHYDRFRDAMGAILTRGMVFFALRHSRERVLIEEQEKIAWKAKLAAKHGRPAPRAATIVKLNLDSPVLQRAPSEGNGSKKRAHFVMGHFRQLPTGLLTWVRPHMRGVGNGEATAPKYTVTP